jgi:hypothetical protein
VKTDATTQTGIPPLGIIMLDTEFARPVGDAGNLASWPFPVLIERVPKAFANDVVTGAFNDVAAFAASAQLLRAKGACAIISTCGFLARFAQFNGAVNDVVICASTLFRYRQLRASIPADKAIAVLTIDANSIDAQIRANCDIPKDAIIVSPPRDGHFCRAILDGAESLDVKHAEREMVQLALGTQRAHPNIALWLFECANMPPYRAAVEAATGVCVYDALHLGTELHADAMQKKSLPPGGRVPDRAGEGDKQTSSR